MVAESLTGNLESGRGQAAARLEIADPAGLRTPFVCADSAWRDVYQWITTGVPTVAHSQNQSESA
jgi:hypothetical protein